MMSGGRWCELFDRGSDTEHHMRTPIAVQIDCVELLLVLPSIRQRGRLATCRGEWEGSVRYQSGC